MQDGDTLRISIERPSKTPAELTSELILQKAIAGDIDETSLADALEPLARTFAAFLSVDAVTITIFEAHERDLAGASFMQAQENEKLIGEMFALPIHCCDELVGTIRVSPRSGHTAADRLAFRDLEPVAVQLAAAISIIRLRQRLQLESTQRQHAESEAAQVRQSLDTLQIPVEQSQMESVLRAEQLRFNKVIATIPGAICTFKLRPDGTLFTPYASKPFEDLYGLTLADVACSIDAIINRVDPADGTALAEGVERSARTMQPWHNEYRYQHPQKGEVWLEGHSMPVRESDGSIVWHGFVTDITERKRAEVAVKVAEQRYRRLFEGAPVMYITTLNQDGRALISDCNQLFLTRLGYTRAEVIGQPLEDFYSPNSRVRLLVGYPLSLQGKLGTEERELLCRDGRIIPTLFEAVPEVDADGRVIGTQASFVDITDRKQAEIALRLSEEKYRGLMESLDSVIALVDYEGRFAYMNDVAASQMGGAAVDLIGKTMGELFPEPVASAQLEHVRQAISTDAGNIYVGQSSIHGTPRWFRTSLQPIHDEYGNVAYALINSTDIHDLKTAQQELLDLNRTLEARVEERTAQVQDLYENAPTGYHTLDDQGNFTQINQTELNWLGYSRSEVVGKPFSDFITPADRKEFKIDFDVLMRNGWVRDLEYQMRRNDSSTFSALISASAVFDTEQRAVASRFTVFDNTERKRAEIALRGSEEQNRLLFEESPDASVLTDGSGCIVKANRAYANMTKYALNELIGNTAEELGLVTRNTAEFLRGELIQSIARGDNFVTAEHQLHCANGSTLTVDSHVFLLQINGITHTLVTSRDISTRKQAEAALRIANAEIERAMRLKDEFLANISHELRTPLSGILALSESLQEQIYGPLNERQLRSLRNIELSGRHLLSLINDLLDLSKIDAGKLELNLESVSVDDVCQASMVFVKEIAGKKQIRLTFDNPEPAAKVVADVRRLKQMLVNLLSNAVKFTPDGGEVKLRVAIRSHDLQIEFSVQDTGIGIAATSIPLLFQPFSQLDSALARQFEGTGLGLALVKRLALQHKGAVRVESAGIPGLGSTFTLVLPYTNDTEEAVTPSTTTQGVVSPRRAANACILLTEDNEVTIDALTGYLEYLGYQVVVARTGLEALEFAELHTPDLILMDIHLPLLDGFEVTRRLRRDARFTTTPIIAVTALAMAGDREQCLEAGANEYLSKPVRVTDLAATVKRLLEPTLSLKND